MNSGWVMVNCSVEKGLDETPKTTPVNLKTWNSALRLLTSGSTKTVTCLSPSLTQTPSKMLSLCQLLVLLDRIET